MEVNILALDKILFQGEADSVLAENYLGRMGIFKNHTPLISVLEKGKLRVRTEKKELGFDIKGGIIRVQNNIVDILLPFLEE